MIEINGQKFEYRDDCPYKYDYRKVAAMIATKEVDEINTLRDLILNDLFFVVRFVLKIPIANHPFWVKCCREIEDGPEDYTLDVWAREHGKSSIITIAETIQFTLKEPDEATGIFSYVRPVAKKFLFSIKEAFQNERILHECFPEIVYANCEKEAPLWSLDEGLILRRTSTRKEPNISAWGLVEGMPTGFHFKRRVYDDISTEDMAESADMMDKVKTKFDSSQNLGSEGGHHRVIGTYYHHADPLTYIRGIKTPEGERRYHYRFKPGSDDGTAMGKPVYVSQKRWDDLKLTRTFNCLPPGSKILTDGGPENIEHIQVGDRVLTHLGRYKKVMNVFTNTCDESLIRIKTFGSNQRDLFLTPNHRVFVLRKTHVCKKNIKGNRAKDRHQYADKPGFVPAEHLKRLDAIYYPVDSLTLKDKEILSHEPAPCSADNRIPAGYLVSVDFWRFVGYWLAEGCVSQKGRIILCFSAAKDQKIKKDCLEIIRKLFKRKPSEVISNGSHQILFTSNEIAIFLREFGCGSSAKHIPEWIHGLPWEFLNNLFAGYLAGDGCIDKDGHEVVTSVSLELLQGFQRILFKLGKPSSVSAPYLKKDNKIQGRICNILPFYRLIATKEPRRGSRRTWKEGDGFYLKIKEIETVPYQGPVYNIEVKDDHSYVSDLYTLSNCQQLLDPSPLADMKLNPDFLLPIERRMVPKNLYRFLLVDQAGDLETNRVRSGPTLDSWAFGVVGVEPFTDDIGQSRVFIEDLFISPLSESEAIEQIVRMYLKAGMIMKVGVEKVGISSTHIHVSKALQACGRHVNFDPGGNGVLLRPAGRNKKKFIEGALSWPLNNGKIFYSTACPANFIERFKMEMRNFPVWHDDGINMLAYLYDLLKDMFFGMAEDEAEAEKKKRYADKPVRRSWMGV